MPPQKNPPILQDFVITPDYAKAHQSTIVFRGLINALPNGSDPKTESYTEESENGCRAILISTAFGTFEDTGMGD